MLDFMTLQTASVQPTIMSAIYTVLLSFILSSVIAFTYEHTFKGLSYSRNFVQAMILISIVAGMVMQAIGDNPIRGLGVLGALSIIRFRTVFKDPRDIIFIFASVSAGIACGVFGYAIAAIGTIGFCLVAVILNLTQFGANRYFDGMLRFNVDADTGSGDRVGLVLKDFCRHFALVTLRETTQGSRLEFAYHVKLKNGQSRESLVGKIREIPFVKDVQLLLQETTVEL